MSDGTAVEKRWNINNPSTPLTAMAAWGDVGGGLSSSGEVITEKNALCISTVYTCVTILAEAVASLPCRLMRSTDDGDTPATDHRLWSLLTESPNEEMTAFTFWSTIVGSSALCGNGYAQIVRDATGAVESIWPLHPNKTEPIRNATGQLAYKTTDGMTDGAYRIIASADVLHFPLFSLDGIKGVSPVTAARESFATARAMEKFGARWFANGAQPSSLLINKNAAKPDAKAQREFVESWQAAHSGINQHKQGFLWGDWSVEQIGLSPEDSQFLIARNYQRSDIASMYKIPVFMVGNTEKLSNNNYTGQQMGFVIDTLRPILVRLEAELKRKLLKSSRFFVEFDVTERQRGDFQTMAQAISLTRQWGVLDADECRALLGYAPRGGAAKKLITQVNMTPLDDLGRHRNSLHPSQTPRTPPTMTQAKPQAHGVVYVITNVITGQKYVGQTVRPVERRWRVHVRDAKACSYRSRLHDAIREHGESNFTVHVQSNCVGRRALDTAERFYIALYRTQNPAYGYNLRSGGQAGSGYKKKPKYSLTKDVLAQHIKDGLSAKEMGAINKCSHVTILRSVHEHFGKTMHEVRRDLCGMTMPSSFCKRQSATRTGTKRTPETRKRQAEAARRAYTPELRTLRREQKIHYWQERQHNHDTQQTNS
ncbi:phage portal protein [Granulicella cerasi]|uniref:Phage portal protein n=1 Tax=Granulicella cerasi TaxID=741063 RepID=A0ABW1Z4H7_9BACT|nr:phage portal protein [Granulicella cerasi]